MIDKEKIFLATNQVTFLKWVEARCNGLPIPHITYSAQSVRDYVSNILWRGYYDQMSKYNLNELSKHYKPYYIKRLKE